MSIMQCRKIPSNKRDPVQGSLWDISVDDVSISLMNHHAVSKFPTDMDTSLTTLGKVRTSFLFSFYETDTNS